MEKMFTQVGNFQIVVSDRHIYLSTGLPSTYDYSLWNIIGEIVRQAKIENVTLIDVGANVGDSLAHFRRHSSEPVICIEPDDHYFELLSENSVKFQPVTLIKKLLAPTSLVGKIAYSSSGPWSGRTGVSSIARSGEDSWKGEYITFPELLTDSSRNYIVKTDTDGFDASIVTALLDSDSSNIPIILLEGPSQEQILNNELDAWATLFSRMQASGYGLLYMTNRGMPYAWSGVDRDASISILASASIQQRSGEANFQYFDIIAVKMHAYSDALRPARWTLNLLSDRRHTI